MLQKNSMLYNWTKILPFFVIEWYIEKHSEVFVFNKETLQNLEKVHFVSPYKNVLIKIKDSQMYNKQT